MRIIGRLLTLAVGAVIGAILTIITWPRTPTGSVLPSRSDVRVSIADGYLARRVQAHISSSGLVAVRRVRISSSVPLLVVDAQASLGPLSAPISLVLQPFPAGGGIQVRIVSTHVGVIPVPGALTGFVAGSINDSLRHTLGANARVTGVTVTPRGLDITANYP